MNIYDQLRRDEGVRLKPYKDSVGKITIGVGRNLDDVGITTDEADLLLHNDVNHAIAMLEQALPWAMNLDEPRLGAMINLCFNMGVGGLLQFKKALAAMESGDYSGAAAEFKNSVWATQVGSRAYRLTLQIESGQWQ